MGLGGIVAFDNVDVNFGLKPDGTTGGPFDVDPPASFNLADASTVTGLGITTVSANAAVVLFAQANNDITHSSWAATNPSSPNEILDFNTNTGDDATVAAAWALRTTAGATGNATATLSSSQRNGGLLIALKPCVVPAQPGTITVPSTVCASSTGNVFSISAVANAASYTWSVSGTGWSITAGQGTTSATITAGSVAGTVSVTANNGACGSSTSRSTGSLTPTTVPAQPGSITTPSTICASSTGNAFSISSVSGATSYTWSVTGTGWSITGGQNTTSATITAGSVDGTVSVTANNGSCSSTSRSTASLTLTALPTANAGSELSAICQGGTSAALGGSVGGSATGGTWSDGGVGGSFSPNATTLNATYTPPANYSGTVTLTLTTSGGSCGTTTASKNLTVTATRSASFSYPASPYCKSLTSATDDITGTSGGTFSSTAGLSINSSTGTVNPSASTAGTYTVTYTVAASGGCSVYTTTASITIANLPTVSISGSTTGCPPLQLTASGASSYSWNGGNSTNTAINTFNASGTYTVTGTDANGCVNTASRTITVNAVPSVTASASAASVCAGGSVNLSGAISGVTEEIITQNDFDGNTDMGYSASGGGTKTGSSASGDRPASSPFFTTSTTGYWVNNGTATITFDNITGLGNYTHKYIKLRLAAFSINRTDRGLDAGCPISAL
jgi:hypothetical protein